MNFLEDIKAFELEAVELAALNTSNITEDFFAQVVANTPTPDNAPFSKGLLVNQWYPAIGDNYSQEATTSTNTRGADSYSRIKSTVKPMLFRNLDNTVTLTNNQEHAYRAEMLGWPRGEGANGWVWSGRQGPYRMVEMSVQYMKGRYV